MGEVEFVDADRSGYFAWFRAAWDQRYFVQLNLTDLPLQIPETDPAAELVLGSNADWQAGTLAAYEARVYCWPGPRSR
jgi:hypothetical protein